MGRQVQLSSRDDMLECSAAANREANAQTICTVYVLALASQGCGL